MDTIPLLSNPALEVLIAGAGPTGLAMAVDFARRGVQFRLIDKLETPPPWSKANSVLQLAMEALDNLGVAPAMLEHGNLLRGMRLHQGDKILANMQNDDDSKTPYPHVLNIPQSSTEKVLTEKLHALGGRIERQIELLDFSQDETGVTAQLKNLHDGSVETVRTRYLVACDGAHSRIRKGLGLPLEGETYNNRFIVSDVHISDWPQASDRAHIWLHKDGFFMISKFKATDLWHIVVNLTHAQDEAMPTPTLADMQALFRERTGDTTAVLRDPLWISKFRIHHRHVRRYSVGRVFLTGDAAHLHSPMAGNGLGNSIQDGLNLAWKLALVVGGKAKETLLDSYEQERRDTAKGVLRIGDIMHRVFTGYTPLFRFAKNTLLPVLLKTVMRFGTRREGGGGMQMNANYRTSPLTAKETAKQSKMWQKSPNAGDRPVNVVLQDASASQPTTLFDHLRGPAFKILFYAKPNELDSGEIKNSIKLANTFVSWLGEDVKPLLIVHQDSLQHFNQKTLANFPGPVLLDHQTKFREAFVPTGSGVYLLRPDNFIAFRSETVSEPDIRAYLETVFYAKTHTPVKPNVARSELVGGLA